MYVGSYICIKSLRMYLEYTDSEWVRFLPVLNSYVCKDYHHTIPFLNIPYFPSYKKVELFHFGIYCLFLHLSWRKISRYFVLEKFVCFHLWEEYDLMCASVEEIFQNIPFWKILSVFICEKSMIWCFARNSVWAKNWTH